jgi:O-antigen ligase
MARSRAAFGAAALAIGASMPALRSRIGAAVAVGLVIVSVPLMVWFTSRSHVSLRDAAAVRLDMTRVAVATIERFPLFGVGLPDYIRVSRRQITNDMVALRAFAPQGENAHNNFLQLGAELGLPALALLLVMIAPVVWQAVAAAPGPGRALAAGLLAFLITACFGHPLLTPLVGAMFFVTLGLASGLSAEGGTRPPRWAGRLALGACVGYGISLVFRL